MNNEQKSADEAITTEITSIDDFLKIRQQIMEDLAEETPAQYSLYYRGEKYWGEGKGNKLLPGIYRKNYIQHEQAIFREATAHNPGNAGVSVTVFSHTRPHETLSRQG
jgi:hypothetical protein